MDQRSSSTLSGFSSPPGAGENPHAKIEMVFRFWGPNGRSAEPPGNESAPSQHPGVLALIEDAVASKHGVFLSTQDQLYVSGLKRPADALVVSRQVQLGLQGFRGKHASAPVAVSIAIDTSGTAAGPNSDAENAGDSASSASAAKQSPEPPHELVTLLKLAKPAQILLTHDLCQQVAAIKGLPLKSFPGRFGVYEYLWTAEDKLDLLQSEPQLTLAALPAAAPSAPAKDKSTPAPAAEALATVAGRGQLHADMVPEKQSAFQSPRVLILAAAALVVLVAAILIGIHLSHSSSANSAPPNPTAPASAPRQTSAPAPVSAPATVQSTAPKPGEKQRAASTPGRQASKPAAHQPAQAEEKQAAATPAPAPSANCTLGANPERFVGLGEQARGRGDYANAIRIFREVLDCDPNNAAAREGLEKATRGQEQH
ncbi:MAG: hypothetical protein WBE38_07500 [Terracidiphilus sp.]